MNESYLDAAVVFHKCLNPALWEDGEMKPEIRETLLAMAKEFQEFLGLDNLDIVDLTVSGSNAAYTYTPHSDVDLHLVVNIPAQMTTLYKELFDAKKNLYNLTHNQTVKGFDVEFYVQSSDDPVESMGIYSVMKDKWLSVPKRVKAKVNDQSVLSKVDAYTARIKEALKSDDYKTVAKTWTDFKNMRKAGLDKGGEFSPENLAFKIMRTRGLQSALYDHMLATKDKELSLESLEEADGDQTVRFKMLKGSDFYYDILSAPENEDIRTRLKYLSNGWRDMSDETVFTALVGEKVVGASGIQVAPSEENVIWVKFVSVDPEYRGKGYAIQLIKNVFQFAKSKGYRVRASSYSDLGRLKLKSAFEQFAKEYDVPFKDGDDHYKFDL